MVHSIMPHGSPLHHNGEGPGVRPLRRRSYMIQPTASRPSAPFLQGSPLIRLEHLTPAFTTRAQRTVILDDVTCILPAQRLFAINGSSVSGKWTVFNMLTGLHRTKT